MKVINSSTSHKKLRDYGILAKFIIAHPFMAKILWLLTLWWGKFLLTEVWPQRSYKVNSLNKNPFFRYIFSLKPSKIDNILNLYLRAYGQLLSLFWARTEK